MNGLIVAVDPGHGFANKAPGVYDPGAVHGNYEEARVVLWYARALEDALYDVGHVPVLTRSNNDEPCPLHSRVGIARAAGADLLISIHCNSSPDALNRGTETLFMHSDGLARVLQRATVYALGLRDRGVKLRDDLAVLRYENPCALVELGFISNVDRDLPVLLDPDVPRVWAREVVRALDAFGG